MANLTIVCAGYAPRCGPPVPCGKTIGYQPISQEQADEYQRQGMPLVSHGMCADCYRKQMAGLLKIQLRTKG